MAAQAAVRGTQQAYPAPSAKPHLLIVTDCPERLRSLQASIHRDAIEITGVTAAAELSRACHRAHDLAVIDVGAARLPEVLRTLRSSVRHSGISLLVEASRVVSEPTLAGLLPKYRAMACSHSELMKLTRRLLTGEIRSRQQRMLL
jgi:hypothetical protein